MSAANSRGHQTVNRPTPTIQLPSEELHLPLYNDFPRRLYITVYCSQTLHSESQLTTSFPMNLSVHTSLLTAGSFSQHFDTKESPPLPNANAQPRPYISR